MRVGEHDRLVMRLFGRLVASPTPINSPPIKSMQPRFPILSRSPDSDSIAPSSPLTHAKYKQAYQIDAADGTERSLHCPEAENRNREVQRIIKSSL